MPHIPLKEIFRNKLKQKIKSKIKSYWKRIIFFNNCPQAIASGSPIFYSKKVKKNSFSRAHARIVSI